MCEDTFVLNCDKDSVIDSMVYKKAQKVIETYTLGGDVKANCPPPLKAPPLPTIEEIMMALNTARAGLGGKTIDKLTKESMSGSSDMSTSVPWVYFYVPFMTRQLDPYIEFLQFTKNYATKNPAADFYKDWEKIRLKEMDAKSAPKPEEEEEEGEKKEE